MARRPVTGQVGGVGASRPGRDISSGIRSDGWNRAARTAAAGRTCLLTWSGADGRRQLDTVAAGLLAFHGVARRSRYARAVPYPCRANGVRGLVAMAVGTPGLGLPGGLDAGAGADGVPGDLPDRAD